MDTDGGDAQERALEEDLEQRRFALDEVLRFVTTFDAPEVREYVRRERAKRPTESPDALVRRIIRRQAWKAGGIGAATGIGGILTLPVTIPANLLGTWRVQAQMVVLIAEAYEKSFEPIDFYLVMSGGAATEVLRSAGIKVGQDMTERWVRQHITREVMKKINKYVSRKIITKAGEKSTFSFVKAVPLVGAPIGFGVDWMSTQAVGRSATVYYRDPDPEETPVGVTA